MSKIVIIGGGASGLIASIYASNSSNEVIILEKNNICGKKILVTGNGRCNYFNAFQDIKHYNSTDKELLEDIVNTKNTKEVLSFFESIGIIPKIKNGYFYPYSNKATSIKEALILEARIRGVNIINNYNVKTINKEKNKFIINNEIECDKVIISTGSYAAPNTGSTGDGYKFVKELGHNIIPVIPALVQLKGKDNIFKEWDGIRCDVDIAHLEDNNIKKIENGEIQLTNYGISGICVFNLSSDIIKGLNNKKKEYVLINFLPFINFNNKNEYIKWLDNRNKLVKKRTISELLDGILNYKLVHALLNKCNINKNKLYNDLTVLEKEILIDILTNFKLEILGYNSYDKAQTCSGGVPLKEIDTLTMESKVCKNLYLTGEILDVDGECGGYNLSFAWITGMLAGKSISNDKD